MSRRLLNAVAGCGLLAATGTFTHAAMLADFEPPAYEGNPATSTDIDGTNGWNNTGGSGVLFPDTNSGYTGANYPPLSGTQSYVLTGSGTFQARGFGAAGSEVGDGSTLSALSGVEIVGGSGFYLSDNAALGGGGSPAGIEYTSGGTFAVFGTGGSTVTAVPFSTQTKYLLEMVFNFTGGTFDAYVTDLTNNGLRTLLADDKGISGAPAASTIATDGGVLLYKAPGGANTYFDDIQITAIPEPASLGLIGLAGAAMLRRRNR